MWRSLIFYTVLLLVLAGLGGFAWLTHHPDSPWLERAQGWPVVGEWAASFRQRYVPPAEPGAKGGGPGGSPGASPQSREARSLEAYDALPALGQEEIRGATEEVWLEPGTALREAPSEEAPVLLEAPGIANVPVLERRGAWARVAYRRRGGWVLAPPHQGPPPLGSAPEPPRPLPAQAAEEARLAPALALLGTSAPAGSLGPYRLYTDVEDRELLAFLDNLAASVEDTYRRRYRRPLVGEPAESVVLFRREADYRAFLETSDRLAGLDASGHATPGMVALSAGERPRWQLAATLVHELVHLLNRRALGPALPPWLDEGLADELGGARVDALGLLVPGALGGSITRHGDRVEFHGSASALRQLRRALDAGAAPPLRELMGLSWEEFVRSPASELHYAASAFFLRYLLAGEGGALAPGFHAFLDGVAAGQPATGEELQRRLGRPWPLVELGFRAWVRFQDDRLEEVAQRPVGL